MTRQQLRICAYIRLNRGRIVNGYEIRDVISPESGVKNIHVQIHNARRAGEHRISSTRGSHGGYVWAAEGRG